MKYRVIKEMPCAELGNEFPSFNVSNCSLGDVKVGFAEYRVDYLLQYGWIEEVVLKPKEESLEDKMMEVLELKSLQAINTRFIFVDKLAQIAKEHYKKHYLGVFDKAYNEWISRSGAGAIESVAITLRKAIREE